MEIDLPEVVAEVREAFERYEKALVTNDVATLDALFRKDERTIRYGVAENLYGHERGRGLPRRALAHQPGAHALAHGDHHLRPRLRRRLHAVPPRQRARQGRPADADLGALSGRLARGRRARQPDRCAQELTTDRRPMTRPRHPRSTSAACMRPTPAGSTRRGGRARVRRHRRGGRPRHLHLARRPQVCAQGRRRSSAASIPRPSRCGASRSPSRTTSTWRGCRPRRPAPRFAYTPKANAHCGGAAARRRRAADRQDQPRPVRDRPGRRAHALSGAAQRLRSRRSCRAARARARPWPWRAGSCRSRSAPTRRARAACRPASTTSSGSKPSVGAVSTMGVVPACRTLDCVSVFAGTVDDAWAVYAVMAGERRGRSRSRGRSRWAPCASRAAGTRSSACRAPRTCNSSATRRRRRPGAPSLKVLEGLGATFVDDRHDAVLRDRRAALRGAVGGRALCGRPPVHGQASRATCIP